MYFQINYIAEPLRKLCTKSYGHVFYYCFLNKQMESYNLKLNNMILFATICVSFLIFTLSCEENLLFRSRRQNFAKVKNSPDNIIPLISFFFLYCMQSLIWIATKQFFRKKVQLKALLKHKKRISLRYMQPPPQNTRDSLNCIHFFLLFYWLKI